MCRWLFVCQAAYGDDGFSGNFIEGNLELMFFFLGVLKQVIASPNLVEQIGRTIAMCPSNLSCTSSNLLLFPKVHWG